MKTIEEINARFDQAITEGKIFNTELKDVKYFLDRMIEADTRAAQNVYLSTEPMGEIRAKEYLTSLYYHHLNANSINKLNRLLRGARFSSQSESEDKIIKTYDQLFLKYVMVLAKFDAVKKIVVKGRKPSAKQVEKIRLGREFVDHNVACLSVALIRFRVDYRARYVSAFQARLEALRQALLTKPLSEIAPCPHDQWLVNRSPVSKKDLAAMNREYAWTRSVCDVRYADILGQAHVKQAAFDGEKVRAIREADLSIDGYIAKLARKIGERVKGVSYLGELWSGSTVIVSLETGAEQRWETRTILNISCLGNVFNQWPTKRIK